MVYIIIEFSRVIFTEPRVFVRSRFQKSADQPNGGSGLPRWHWGCLLAITRGVVRSNRHCIPYYPSHREGVARGDPLWSSKRRDKLFAFPETRWIAVLALGVPPRNDNILFTTIPYYSCHRKDVARGDTLVQKILSHWRDASIAYSG